MCMPTMCRGIGGRKRSRSSADVDDEAEASEQDEPAQPVDFHGIASAAVSTLTQALTALLNFKLLLLRLTN